MYNRVCLLGDYELKLQVAIVHRLGFIYINGMTWCLMWLRHCWINDILHILISSLTMIYVQHYANAAGSCSRCQALYTLYYDVHCLLWRWEGIALILLSVRLSPWMPYYPFIIPQFAGEGTPHKQHNLGKLPHGKKNDARRKIGFSLTNVIFQKRTNNCWIFGIGTTRLYSAAMISSCFNYDRQANVIRMFEGRIMCLWEVPQICTNWLIDLYS